MKKVIFILLFCVAISCQKYDDTQIKSDISTLQSRVSALELLCGQLNSDISSMKDVVIALQEHYYVSNIISTENGYTIMFTNGKSIDIHDGKDGKDGENGADGKDGVDGKDGKDGEDGVDGKDGDSPVISVKLGEDGIWYWTLNGEWLLDSNGARIPTTGVDGKDGKDGVDGKDGKDGENGADGKDGVDGKDGITPQLKIKDEYWYISTDNGITWTQLGKATGEDGDSMFSGVSQDNDYAYLTLADGSVIKLPKAVDLSLNFDRTLFHPTSSSLDVPFSVNGATSDLRVVVFSDNTISTKIELSGTEGILKVDFLTDTYSGNVMVAAKSNGKVIMEILEFEKGILSTSTDDEFNVPASGSRIKITVSHNVDILVTTSADWITQTVETKTAVTEDLFFDIHENEAITPRDGTVDIKGEGGLFLSLKIHQAQKDILVLEKNSVSMFLEDSVKLSYSTNVESSIVWKSTNPEIVVVDSSGVVKGVSRGNAMVIVSTEDGKLSDTCSVSVINFTDKITVSCVGGSFRISGTLILYGSSIYWNVSNNTGETINVESVYLIDGENNSKTGSVSLNVDIASGSSSSWGIGAPLVGIHYPVTAVFTVSCKGKQYSVSGTYNYRW